MITKLYNLFLGFIVSLKEIAGNNKNITMVILFIITTMLSFSTTIGLIVTIALGIYSISSYNDMDKVKTFEDLYTVILFSLVGGSIATLVTLLLLSFSKFLLIVGIIAIIYFGIKYYNKKHK